MAQATTRRFSQFKIYIGDGATPEEFVTPCGFNEASFVVSKDLTETTVPDCDDPDAAAWVERDVRSLSASFSGDGVMAMESFPTWRDWSLSSEPKNVRVEIAGTGSQGGGYYAFAAHLESCEQNGTRGERVTCSVEGQSTGPVTWVAAAG